jgi:hypothetical protein
MYSGLTRQTVYLDNLLVALFGYRKNSPRCTVSSSAPNIKKINFIVNCKVYNNPHFLKKLDLRIEREKERERETERK